MKRIRETLSSRRGMALLLVLCLFAMLTALGSSLFFAANASVLGSINRFDQEQARLSAQSVCESVIHELTTAASSPLRLKVNTLMEADTLPLSATLEEGMGNITGSMQRVKNNQIILQVTAQTKKSKATLELLLTRTGTEPDAKWVSNGYRSLVPIDEFPDA